MDNRPPLGCVFDPKSVAIVGASDTSRFGVNTHESLDSDADVFFVTPRHPTVFGRPTYPSLALIGRPVDAVLSVMSADRTADLTMLCPFPRWAGGCSVIADGGGTIAAIGAAAWRAGGVSRRSGSKHSRR